MELTVETVVEDLKLEIVSGESGLHSVIMKDMLSKPGMELAGFFDFYESDRVQILGSKEGTFFHWLNEEDQLIRVRMLFEAKPPAFIFSKNVDIPKVFIKYGEEFGIPVLRSAKRTTPLFSELYSYLQGKLAERTSLHGVLLDINGVGVLIRGKSGVGKSEIALELVRRGHQLVADDRIDIFQKEKGVLIGEAPEILKKYLEIRGIGIINIIHLFGAKAYRDSKRISLIVDLELWNDDIDYDRLGLSEETFKLFETNISYVKIPVTEARNVASLVEVAARNYKLKLLGYNSAKEFADTLDNAIKNKS